MIFSWLLTAFVTWLLISVLMFVFTMGNMSAIDGAPYRKAYWKWSILLTLYITIPFVGWIVGIIHVTYVWNKIKQDNAKATQPKETPPEQKND